ncbi:pilus assembly protein [Sulfitobacter sp. JBTF-M27]|uniref:Pilus assembly protein n=1 Tax=Sulfitobacter sediminilitoris TaxID=2698830 RepID=A0A6P0CEX6_9RHOB|nr:TadE/TadG family type IV pilus assembly protein [Sulfitobacter sediminilitoris]NEK24721.1 pilus assembly protein [Sulfitobacter sediminilitoris]
MTLLSVVSRFFREELGVVLIETLLAIPFLTLLTFTILEFGNILWQREQLQTGVKDAARYWARCRPVDGNGAAFMPCSIDTARAIAFTGLPSGGAPRVPGWDESSELTIVPGVPPGVPTSDDLVVVSGAVTYQGSPMLNAIFPDSFSMGYSFQTRYIGW